VFVRDGGGRKRETLGDLVDPSLLFS